MPQRSVLVFPEDSSQSIINIIDAANTSINIKMFLFSSPEIINAVIAAFNRGVKVRVMLNPARRSGKQENKETKHKLEKAGIEVKDTNPAFSVTHEKSMVVDGQLAMIKSLNWETKNLTKTRDYAIITDHPEEVKEILDCFDADWERKEFDSSDNAGLVWCTGNGRAKIAKLIDEAQNSLFIQNERYQDMVIIERLVSAANRGVKIKVMAKAPHTLKQSKLLEGVGGLRILKDVGIKIKKLKGLKLHGKILIADQKKAIVGSINLTPGSFDDRRELAIEIEDEKIINRLNSIAKLDWDNSKKLDLTDEGLLQDLKKRLGELDQLVLNTAEKPDIEK